MLDVKYQQLLLNQETYGLPKVEGLTGLRRNEVILEEGLVGGDKVLIYLLPGNKKLLTKDSRGILIKKITSAFVFFDVDILIKEE